MHAPTRGLLAVETMHAIVHWLENLNIKRIMTSMFVNKIYRYKLAGMAPTANIKMERQRWPENPFILGRSGI